ncbi:hypothetical protein [Microbacterium sp. JZ37]|uniref:hypothetical protein n=1 Tax=Microbacterium sp. JZ37 TaxID=2654193 RepID=UPI002B47EAE5|nr:hypothetical protein [Microbacterium sp. JZ37]
MSGSGRRGALPLGRCPVVGRRRRSGLSWLVHGVSVHGLSGLGVRGLRLLALLLGDGRHDLELLDLVGRLAVVRRGGGVLVGRLVDRGRCRLLLDGSRVAVGRDVVLGEDRRLSGLAQLTQLTSCEGTTV